MRALRLLGAACIMAVPTLPAFAASSMATMSMMKAGETVAVMPDGHMGTMMANTMESADMMKMATPVDHCVMMMMGKDGKMYMVDTTSADSMKSCEAMAK
jgi:hypothetical protein